MNKPIVSIIIVNYNTGSILEKCIRSIFQFEKNDFFEIIIVDQNSNDNSKEVILNLAKEFKNIKYLFNKNNSGFAKGVNKGYEIAKGDYLIILNPDIILIKPVIVELISLLKVISLFNRKGIGAISPLLKGVDGNIQYEYYQKYPSILQFIFFHSLLSKLFHKLKSIKGKYHYDENLFKNKTGLVKTKQLPCAFLLLPSKIFREIGKMNENYFLFFEDMDLSYRINKKYELFVDCGTEVKHLGGASFNINNNPEIYGYYMISYITFFKQNYNYLSTLLIKSLIVLNSFIIISIEKIKQLFNKQNKFRFEKHKFFIKLFFNSNLKRD